MPTFDVTYLMERVARIEAPDLAAAKVRGQALVLTAAPAKLLSVHPYPYVPVDELTIKDAPRGYRRDCQCPDCVAQRNADTWSEKVMTRAHHEGLDSFPVSPLLPEGEG